MSLFNAIDTTRWIESVYGEYIYIGGEILQSFDNTAIIVERKIKKKKKTIFLSNLFPNPSYSISPIYPSREGRNLPPPILKKNSPIPIPPLQGTKNE